MNSVIGTQVLNLKFGVLQKNLPIHQIKYIYLTKYSRHILLQY